jgi:hypothetical protein
MVSNRSRQRLCASCIVLFLAAVPAACHRKPPEPPPMATPSIRLSHDKAPLGSPIDITYRFVVAPDARFDQDYRVMMHVVDTDEEMIWNDDHTPPVPTSRWKPGETVEYTRTIFVPVYPYVGEASIQIGLYSTATQKRLPLAGENVGQRAYKVARFQLQPQTENLPTIFKEGWHPAEVAEHNAMVQWQWTKKDGVIAFKNPKKDSLLYLELDNPGSVFTEAQHVTIRLNGATLDEFALQPKEPQLKRLPLTTAQLGTDDMAELRIAVDKTYVPALMPASNNKDPRELGVRVFHVFIDPR